MEKINKILPAVSGGCFIGASFIRIGALLISEGRLFADYWSMLYLFAGLVAFLALLDKKASFAVAGFSVIMAFSEAQAVVNIFSYTLMEKVTFKNILSIGLDGLSLLGYLLAAAYILFALSKPDSFISKLWFVPSVLLLVAIIGGVLLNIEYLLDYKILDVIGFILIRISLVLIPIGIGVSCMNLSYKKQAEEVEEA